MIIVGCDFHPSFQQIAMLDTETGATEERKLMHASGEVESFYRKLASPTIVGIETIGNDQWFVQLLQKLGHEVCVGDAAQIRASYVRKQKTDRRNAKHILQLLVEGRFPCLRQSTLSPTKFLNTLRLPDADPPARASHRANFTRSRERPCRDFRPRARHPEDFERRRFRHPPPCAIRW